LFSNVGMWVAIIITVILQTAIVFIPALNPVFKTISLEWNSLLMILIVAAASLVSIELLKMLMNRARKVTP
jgi:Ca2+-transporting ATPase